MKGRDQSEFRIWRTDLGLTQKDAAMKLGYSRYQIQKYDQGRKAPDLTMRLAMSALVHGIPPYENDIYRLAAVAA